MQYLLLFLAVIPSDERSEESRDLLFFSPLSSPMAIPAGCDEHHSYRYAEFRPD